VTGERGPRVPVPPGFDPSSVVLSFRVPNELEGQRLDRFLEWRIPRLSRARAREIIVACAAHPDGRRRAPSERLHLGETVLLVRERFVEPEAPRTFGVLFEDEAMLVVDKPAGLPVHPSATYHRNTLTALLRERYGERAPHIAHRLDKETSGIVVCGRPGPDEAALKKQFELRKVEKAYLAIVRGPVADDYGTIDLPIGRRLSEDTAGGVRADHLLMEVRDDGQPAFTRYQVVARRKDRTLLKLWPETGRQHQLRVHLASIGHPILGDKLYGPEGQDPFLELIESGQNQAGTMSDDIRARLGHHRHALHAAELALDHPRTGERLKLVAPLPDDLKALLEE
jgi:23S rRNA pseudouridine1911/1915/1917 synthase